MSQQFKPGPVRGRHFGLFLSLMMSIIVLVPSGAHAQGTPKLGFVDFDVIIQKLPEFKTVESQMKDLQKSMQDTLTMIQNDFQSLVDNYKKQQAMMTADARAQEETKINGRRDQYLQYQQDRFGQQGVLAQTQAKLLSPIREKVHTAVEKVAKDERLTAVMETGMMVYYDRTMDITFKVLDYLQRGHN